MLFSELRRVATMAADGMEQEGEALAAQDAAEAVRARPAFVLRLEGQGLKRRGNVYLDERFFARMAADDDEELKQFLTPRYRPMLVEPRRWQGFDSVRASLRGCQYIPRRLSFSIDPKLTTGPSDYPSFPSIPYHVFCHRAAT